MTILQQQEYYNTIPRLPSRSAPYEHTTQMHSNMFVSTNIPAHYYSIWR